MGFHISYHVDGDPVGEPEQPIADPFVIAGLTIGWRDLIPALLRRKKIRVQVTVDADPTTRLAVRTALAAETVTATGKDRLVALSQRISLLELLLTRHRAECDQLLDAELAVLNGPDGS